MHTRDLLIGGADDFVSGILTGFFRKCFPVYSMGGVSCLDGYQWCTLRMGWQLDVCWVKRNCVCSHFDGVRFLSCYFFDLNERYKVTKS